MKLKQDHFLFTTTFLYTNMLQAFAFRQAFNLDFKIVRDLLGELYYDADLINDLEDTGLFSRRKKR